MLNRKFNALKKYSFSHEGLPRLCNFVIMNAMHRPIVEHHSSIVLRVRNGALEKNLLSIFSIYGIKQQHL